MAALHHRLIMAPFPALELWLVDELAGSAHGGGRLGRVTLLSDAALVRWRVQSALRAESISGSGPRWLSLSDFAEQLAPSQTALPLLPRGGADAILRAATRGAAGDGYFAPVLDRPGLRAAILSVLDELAHSGAGDPQAGAASLRVVAEAAAQGPAKLASLARLLVAYRDVLAGRYLDPAERLTAALQAIQDGTASVPDPLYVYWFTDFSELVRQFLSACSERVAVTALLPHDGSSACRGLDALREFYVGLGCETIELPTESAAACQRERVRRAWFAPDSQPNEPQNEADGSLAIVAAPGETREVREAVREVAKSIRAGVPAGESAILFRDGARYRSLAHEILQSACIPHYIPGGLHLSETPAGRAALLLLRLAGSELRRNDVIEFFLVAPLDWEAISAAGEAVEVVAVEPRPAVWDRLTRQAGIVKGAGQWTGRLQALQTSLTERLAKASDDAQMERLRLEIEQVAALQQYAGTLFAWLDALAVPRPWQDAVDHLAGLLREIFVSSDDSKRVVAVIEELGLLAGLEPDGDAIAFQNAAAGAISQAMAPFGRFGEGVFVGDLTNARGLCFRLVCLLGVGERMFPAPSPIEPVLDDDERRALNALGPGRIGVPGDRAGGEDLLFHFVLHAASERLMLCYPFINAEGKERLPSHFLLRAGEVLTGSQVDAQALARAPGYRRISAARLAPDEPADALTPLEYDLSEVLRAIAKARAEGSGNDPAGPPVSERLGYLDRLTPAFARARIAVAARWGSRTFGAYDGAFQSAVARKRIARRRGLEGRPLAPTALEAYATCPRRYFLANVLALAPVEEPEAVWRLRADHRGTLVHTIMERLYRGLIDEGLVPLVPESRAAYHERLQAIAQEEFARAQAQGLTGPPLLWELEQLSILDDLEEWLQQELGDAAREGLCPVLLESWFGGQPRTGGEPVAPVDYTLNDGRTLAFQGVIDRVDRSADGRRFRVIDYKTGRAWGRVTPNLLQKGQALQLPVYLLAAAKLAGLEADAAGSAEYYYVSRRGGFKRVKFEAEALRSRGEEFATILGAIAGGVEKGCFVPTPGANAANCTFCNFNTVCDARVVNQYEYKKGDPAIQNLLALELIE